MKLQRGATTKPKARNEATKLELRRKPKARNEATKLELRRKPKARNEAIH